MLPWLAFSEAAGRAPTVMLEHRNFVKKLVFAVETLPVNLVAAGLVTEFFAVVLFCVLAACVARQPLPVSVLWLPVLLVPQLLFTAGLSWFLAALGVFVRDLGQIMGFLMTIWFFITPICYPEDSLPGAVAPLLTKNPMYVLVRGYRAIFLENPAPGVRPALETVAALSGSLRARTRLVLQAAEILRRHDLRMRAFLHKAAARCWHTDPGASSRWRSSIRWASRCLRQSTRC